MIGVRYVVIAFIVNLKYESGKETEVEFRSRYCRSLTKTTTNNQNGEGGKSFRRVYNLMGVRYFLIAFILVLVFVLAAAFVPLLSNTISQLLSSSLWSSCHDHGVVGDDEDCTDFWYSGIINNARKGKEFIC